jgi:hypothetical protein
MISRRGEETDRVISVLHKYIREQIGHPTFNGVRIAINQGTDTENSGVALANSGVIDW